MRTELQAPTFKCRKVQFLQCPLEAFFTTESMLIDFHVKIPDFMADIHSLAIQTVFVSSAHLQLYEN